MEHLYQTITKTHEVKMSALSASWQEYIKIEIKKNKNQGQLHFGAHINSTNFMHVFLALKSVLNINFIS